MNADNSASASDDVPPSKDGTSSTTKESGDGPQSKDDASAPPQSNTSSAATPSDTSEAAAAAKKHKVTEVPKFRFVSIAKKSAGYSSAAAGRWVEGKSAQELAGKYEGPNKRVDSVYDRAFVASSDNPSSLVEREEKEVVGNKLNNDLAQKQQAVVVGDEDTKREVVDVDTKKELNTTELKTIVVF